MTGCSLCQSSISCGLKLNDETVRVTGLESWTHIDVDVENKLMHWDFTASSASRAQLNQPDITLFMTRDSKH